MLRWPEFKKVCPQISDLGEQMLFNPKAGEVAILATVDSRHRPWVAPVCPIFTDKGLYLLAATQTPKAHHLLINPNYSLHALLGPDDLEFQVSGTSRFVSSEKERLEVLSVVPFPSFDASDPIFELQIARALTVTWPEPGKKNQISWKTP